ncbi:unnamed protein product [Rhizophagus irregularis]|nr:unnamed protein product [Rhizophagus irregularis]
MYEKFNFIDTLEIYEKRIRSHVDGMPYADALPILLNHLPKSFEIRVRIANPADLNAFFTELNNKWLEAGGPYMATQAIQQIATPSQALAIHPQKDDFKICLARDLAYSGIATDDATLENFIYEEFQKRLGSKTAHVYRKSPFIPRSAYAIKKVVRKVVPKASAKQTQHCLACRKAGHTKVNCPKGKRTKKVNHVYQDEEEDPEDPEEEYIEEYIEDSEEEEVEEDDENIDDDADET